MRPGFTPTFRIRMRASGWMAPRTIQAAAELASPGTSISRLFNGPGPMLTLFPFTEMSAPMARSIRSVWSRVAEGWCTTVRPLRPQPRQQHGRFNLGASHRESVVNPPKPTTTNLQGRVSVTVPAKDFGAHEPQGLYHPTHGALDEGVVAGQHGEKRGERPALPTSFAWWYRCFARPAPAQAPGILRAPAPTMVSLRPLEPGLVSPT